MNVITVLYCSVGGSIYLCFLPLFHIRYVQCNNRGCCAALCATLFCCCRKKPALESRRTSMNSKKQSIAPTLPPEDNRPKLDESLIDHTSVMKAAIPVLPIGLAWFCLICNCVAPGTGKYVAVFKAQQLIRPRIIKQVYSKTTTPRHI